MVSEIRIQSLKFSYTEHAEVLKGLQFILKEQSTAIIGQNGAGKTTFVKLLKGLIRPSSGDIFLNDKNLREYTASELARHIGLVFQNPNDQIFKNNVLDEVMFGPLHIAQDKNEAKRSALDALKMVGLETYAHKNPYDLSLAERKMIAIASILAMDTKVIIFDEPTMGQDYVGKQRIKEIIWSLRRRGKLVICILHDMDFAAEVFERTIVFNEGNILLDGTPATVFTNKEMLEKANLAQPYVIQVANQLEVEGTHLTVEQLIEGVRPQ